MGKKKRLEGRIHYEENWHGEGEHFVYEIKWSDEDEWGLEVAYKLRDYNGEAGAVVSYQAITKIRDWMNLGVDFRFGK